MKSTRRPNTSEKEPQKLGARPWTIIYTVTVNVARDMEMLSSYIAVSKK